MDFSKSIQAFAQKTGRDIHSMRRAVGMKLFSAVIQDTPVDSGRLRGNWQTSIGTAKETTLDIRPEGAALAELYEVIQTLHGDQVLILRNNLPYGPRIEYDGWSHTKAPAGMVRINIARFSALLNEAVREVKS